MQLTGRLKLGLLWMEDNIEGVEANELLTLSIEHMMQFRYPHSVLRIRQPMMTLNMWY